MVEKLQWNPNRPRWPQKRTLERIDRVILHQSLGHADTTGNRDVFGINNYHISPGNHISAGGCPHICYHHCIDDDGSIYLCNKLTDVVWHCKGRMPAPSASCWSAISLTGHPAANPRGQDGVFRAD
jgi:hypothetical protein